MKVTSIKPKSNLMTGDFVQFYFKKFGDYFTAFQAFKWDQLREEEFRNIFNDNSCEGVQLDVLNMYYNLAIDQHKRIIDKPVYECILRGIELYEAIIKKHFQAFKKSFSVYAESGIGFVGYVYFFERKPIITFHGFRPVKNGSEKIIFIADNIKDTLRDRSGVWLHGARGMVWNHLDFMQLLTVF